MPTVCTILRFYSKPVPPLFESHPTGGTITLPNWHAPILRAQHENDQQFLAVSSIALNVSS